MRSNNIKLINEFIDNCSDFWDEKSLGIDKKHQNIIHEFNNVYKDKIKKFSKDIIDWSKHSDNGCPFQISKYHLNKFSISEIFYKLLKEIYKNITNNKFDKNAFFDDISIIKETKAYSLLKEFPAHLSDLRKDVYFIEKNISANYRWLRYIYISNMILQNKLINDGNTWVDIGSFYGGIQGIVKTKIPNITLVLVDFNHQLCRSYVYLKNLFPDTNHIFPNTISKGNKLNNVEKNSILYVKVNDFKKIDNIKADLISNFFSFGEMKRKSFNNYYESKLLNDSKYMYLINRFVSSPFFEKTYDADLNIFDYIKNGFDKEYFDIFPMHHYFNFKRNIFGRNNKRPASSPYFELILKNKKLKK